MPSLKIKQVSAAARCEICHQSDLYDAVNNRCLRCLVIPVSMMRVETQSVKPPLPPPPRTIEIIDNDSVKINHRNFFWNGGSLISTPFIFTTIFIALCLALIVSGNGALVFVFAANFIYIPLILLMKFFTRNTVQINSKFLTVETRRIISKQIRRVPLSDIDAVYHSKKDEKGNLGVRLRNGEYMRLLVDIKSNEALAYIQDFIISRTNAADE